MPKYDLQLFNNAMFWIWWYGLYHDIHNNYHIVEFKNRIFFDFLNVYDIFEKASNFLDEIRDEMKLEGKVIKVRHINPFDRVWNQDILNVLQKDEFRNRNRASVFGVCEAYIENV